MFLSGTDTEGSALMEAEAIAEDPDESFISNYGRPVAGGRSHSSRQQVSQNSLYFLLCRIQYFNYTGKILNLSKVVETS